MEIILPAVSAALGTIIAAWIARPKTLLPADKNTQVEAPSELNYTESGKRHISSSVILGCCGLFAWIFPIVGVPLALIGTGIGISHIAEIKSYRFAYTGIWLNIIALMCSVANSAIGAYMGYNGLF